jgi:group I intron endonuclease
VTIYNHHTIYRITNLINNKVYVGQTIQKIERRLRQHLRDSKNLKLKFPIYLAMRKYGIKNFICETICVCSNIKELNNKETFFILKYRSNEKKFGYNCDTGGKNKIPNKETRKKYSKRSSGKKNGMYGKKHKNKSIRLMSLNRIIKTGKDHHHYGIPRSKNTKRKISQNHTDVSGKNNPSYDHKIYHWVHKGGKEVHLTRYRFQVRYKIKSPDCLRKLIRKKQKIYKNWSIRF